MVTRQEIQKANLHKVYRVNIPDQISLFQLDRWVEEGFVPLPWDLEITLYNRVFEETRFGTHQNTRKLLKALKSGMIKAYSVTEDGIEKIPLSFWQIPCINIVWHKSIAAIVKDMLDKGDAEGKKLIKNFENEYGKTAYYDVVIDTKDVVKVFGLERSYASRVGFGSKEEASKENRALWVSFDKINRRVLLNDIFIIAEPKVGSESYKLIDRLTSSPNTEININDIQVTSLHQVLNSLGFKKVLKSLFIESGKGTVRLINPVTHERMIALSDKEPIKVSFPK